MTPAYCGQSRPEFAAPLAIAMKTGSAIGCRPPTPQPCTVIL
jgi:hypothetical protein